MKQKLIALQNLARRAEAKVAVGLMTLLVAGHAAAQGAPTLDTVLDTFVASIITGVGTTFAKIGPLLALVFGIAFAWRWVKKGSKQ
jgi:hypothetical protein